jgi:hypothetical protein
VAGVNKVLKIRHDGKLIVSTLGTLVLGETALADVISQALSLKEGEYKECTAEVDMYIRFKPGVPDVRWREEEEWH